MNWAELTVACTSNGVVVTDNDGHIHLINHHAVEILNLAPGQYEGQMVENILPVSAAMVRRCLQKGESTLGFQAQSKDGSDTIVINITPIEKDGRIVGAVCNFQPYTRFDTIARQLSSFKQMHRQLEAIINSSSDGIFVTDGSGKILNMNHASEELSGIESALFIGRNISALLDEGLIDHSVTLDVLKSEQAINRMVNVKRTGRTILVTGTPVRDEQGNIELVVLNERDMTTLNQIREELHQVKEVKDRLRDELSAVNLGELEGAGIVAESESMQQVLRGALKLMQLGCNNVLITGESGTGKGLLSKFIHKKGPCSSQAFIHINCAALPETLLEAELFGYEKGAFTGARQSGKPGLIELADGGTLFLDEIGEMPMQTQTKLLKYLDDGCIMRLGGTQEIPTNSAVIAATNVDLAKWAKEKKFRYDLYYRLNVFRLHIPPLRKRPEDIISLVRQNLSKFNQKYRQQRRIGARAMELLIAYPFPGNVRELINLINKAVALSESDDLYHYLRQSLSEEKAGAEKNRGFTGEIPVGRLKDLIDAYERRILQSAIAKHRTTRAIAAALELNQSTIVRKLTRHGLRAGDAKLRNYPIDSE